MSATKWHDRLYPEASSRDPMFRFRELLAMYAHRDADVLDLGAGAGHRNDPGLRGKVRRLVGVDLDPRVESNPLLDAGVVGDIMALPFPEDSFDMIFGIYVLEHIEDPMGFAAEIARVLRPGGYFLALTPNRYHYVAMVSSLLPNRLHKPIVRWIEGRSEEDTFPTWYRLNTRRKLAKVFGSAGMEAVSLETIEVWPNYLTFSTPTFLLGALYERLVNSTEALSTFRVDLLPVFRLPSCCSGE